MDVTHCRHQHHVAQASGTSATEMGMTETQNHRIGIMIAGATVPSIGTCIGAKLNHAEGHGCAGISVAMATGPDKGKLVVEGFRTYINWGSQKEASGQSKKMAKAHSYYEHSMALKRRASMWHEMATL